MSRKRFFFCSFCGIQYGDIVGRIAHANFSRKQSLALLPSVALGNRETGSAARGSRENLALAAVITGERR